MRRRLLDRAESGATAVEYALLVALVAAAIFVPLQLMGLGMDAYFVSQCNNLRPVVTVEGGCPAPPATP